MELYVFRPGDKVKVVSNTFGTRAAIGKIYQIVTASVGPGTTAITSDYYAAMEIGILGKTRGRINVGIYHGDLIKGYGSRKEQAEHLKEEVATMKIEIKQKEDEIEYLLKYKDEEEYLAVKIADIMKNKNDTAAIAEILRKHKTDLL